MRSWCDIAAILSRELVDRQRLDLLGEALVGEPPLLALGLVAEPGARPDQHQARHAVGQCERNVQRDPAPLRVADQRE
jgi:hypothetical protein